MLIASIRMILVVAGAPEINNLAAMEESFCMLRSTNFSQT